MSLRLDRALAETGTRFLGSSRSGKLVARRAVTLATVAMFGVFLLFMGRNEARGDSYLAPDPRPVLDEDGGRGGNIDPDKDSLPSGGSALGSLPNKEPCLSGGPLAKRANTLPAIPDGAAGTASHCPWELLNNAPAPELIGAGAVDAVWAEYLAPDNSSTVTHVLATFFSPDDSTTFLQGYVQSLVDAGYVILANQAVVDDFGALIGYVVELQGPVSVVVWTNREWFASATGVAPYAVDFYYFAPY